jgi:hypothetical protein
MVAAVGYYKRERSCLSAFDDYELQESVQHKLRGTGHSRISQPQKEDYKKKKHQGNKSSQKILSNAR